MNVISMAKKIWSQHNKGCVLGLALLGTYGVGYLGAEMGVEKSQFSILLAFVLPAIFMLLMKVQEKNTKKRTWFSYGVSYLFSVTMILGYQLQRHGITDSGVVGKGLILIKAAALAIAFYPFINILMKVIEDVSFAANIKKAKRKYKPAVVFAICSVVIFLCLVPVWLAYYPIIMSYDFHRQVNEAEKGFEYFWPYQPIAHTWLIWLALQIGKILGSRESGMACMAIFQMSVYSLVTGYACSFIYRVVRKTWPVVAAVIFFGVFPFNTVLTLCTSKDVLFSSLFLLFFILFCEWRYFPNERTKKIVWIGMVLTECLMTQFRNNALYAVVAFMIILLITSSVKKKLEVFLLSVCLIAGSLSTGAIIKTAIGTDKDIYKVEMYNVPIQQFARVGYYHESFMKEEDIAKLDYYVPQNEWQYYTPAISDGMKFSLINDWYNHVAETDFFKDWLYFFQKYPNEFIDAFLELTRGYWFVDDTSWAECLGSGVEYRFGAIYTYYSSETELGSIEHTSKLPGLERVLEKIVSGNSFYQWPVVSVLFRCSTYVWGLFFLWLTGIYLKKRNMIELLLLPLAYIGTLLLGPVALSRYVYPFFLIMPICIIMLFISEPQ